MGRRGLAGLSAQSGRLLRQGGSHHLVKLIAKPILRQIADRGELVQDTLAQWVFDPAGHQDDRQGRVVGRHGLDDLQPVHARHGEIGDDEVRVVFAPQANRLGPIRSVHDPVVVGFQSHAQRATEVVMVVNQQDRGHPYSLSGAYFLRRHLC